MKRLGEKLEAAAENPTLMHAAIKPPEAKATQTLYVMNDGGMVPMRSEWRECKLAVLFRDDRHVKVMPTYEGDSTTGGTSPYWESKLNFKPSCSMHWHHAIEHASDCCKALYGESANDCDPGPSLMESTVEPEARLIFEENEAPARVGFFQSKEARPEPQRLLFYVGAREALAWPLDRKVHVIQKARHGAIVKAPAEDFSNQLANHRASAKRPRCSKRETEGRVCRDGESGVSIWG